MSQLKPNYRQLVARCALFGFTVDEVALKAGFARSTLWRWRQGYHDINPSQVERIDEALKELIGPEKRLPSDPLQRVITRLAQVRQAKGITQHALADTIGVSTNLVAQWECYGKIPSGFNLSCWAQALGVSLDIDELVAA